MINFLENFFKLRELKKQSAKLDMAIVKILDTLGENRWEPSTGYFIRDYNYKFTYDKYIVTIEGCVDSTFWKMMDKDGNKLFETIIENTKLLHKLNFNQKYTKLIENNEKNQKLLKELEILYKG